MSWPLPQDFNEAVQNPATAFSDPDLRDGQTVVGPTGLPLPRSGNFADVYQVRAADNRDWAMKCFTRPVTGLGERYRKLEEALKKAALPFTIGFAYLNEGVMVHGEWRAAVKMEWVDGLQLNQAVRVQAGSPKVLDALGMMWSRLCKKLREAGVAHADLQHGNVLLVAGSKAGTYSLKLIDYDGMYVPSLANTPSGESGHPNYQHPQRAAKQVYSPDLDRFPHLVIATALKGLAVLGPKLWEKYDTGDNLLFTEDDFKAPAASALMRELWQSNDSGLQALVGHLAVACGKPIPQTPWLDQIAPDGAPIPLTPDQARNAAAALGVPPPPSAAVVPVQAEEYGVDLVAPPSPSINAFAGLDDAPPVEELAPRKRVRERDDDDDAPAPKKSLAMPLLIGGGVLALVLAGIAGVVMLGDNKPDEVTQKEKDKDQDKDKPPIKDKDKPKPPEVTPPKKDPIVPPDPIPKEPETYSFDPAGVPELNMRWQALTLGNASGAKFTSNGEYIVAKDANAPNEVRVFAASTGTKLAGFTEGESALVDFACLSDGNVVSWHADQPFAIVWNPATGKGVGKLPIRSPGFAPGPKIFDASPDGRYVVVGHGAPPNPKPDENGQVSLFDTQSGKEILSAVVLGPKFRFHDDQFIIADVDQLQAYRLPSGRPGRSAKFGNVNRNTKLLACSADGNLVLHPGRGRDPQVIDCKAGRGVLVVFPLRFMSNHATLSEDGRLVAVCTPVDKQKGESLSHIEVMDLTAKKLIGRYVLSAGAVDVGSIAFAPDNSAMVISRSGKRVQMIDLPKGGAVAVVPKMKDPDPMPKDPPKGGDGYLVRWSKDAPRVSRAWYSPNGKHIFVHQPGNDAKFDAFDSQTGSVDANLKPEPGFAAFQSVEVLDEGRVFALTASGQPLMWSLKGGDKIDGFKAAWFPPEKENSRSFHTISPNGKYAFSARIGRPKPNEAGRKPELEPAPFKLANTATDGNIYSSEWGGGTAHFSADSKWLVLYDSKGSLRRINPATGSFDGGFALPVNVPMISGVISLSADGSTMIFYGELTGMQHGYYVVDTATGRLLRTLSPNVYASRTALSADGKRAASVLLRQRGGGLPTAFDVQVIDVASGKIVEDVKFDLDLNSARDLRFAPDLSSFTMIDQAQGKVVVCEFKNAAVAVAPKMKDPDPTPPEAMPGIPSSPDPAKFAIRALASSPANPDLMAHKVFVSRDGLSAIFSSKHAGVLGTYDMRTAEAGPGFKDHESQKYVFWFGPLANGKVWSIASGDEVATVWDPKTGKAGETIKFPQTRGSASARTYYVSPDGRYSVLAENSSFNTDVPLKVLDTRTSKEPVSLDWRSDQVFFTADSSRMLVFESTGRGRWFKMPSGEADGEWKLEVTPRAGEKTESVDLSWDGRWLLCNGNVGEKPNVHFIVDARTGRIARVLGDSNEFVRPSGAISADGRVVALVRYKPGELAILEAATGKVLDQTPVAGSISWDLVGVALSPDARKAAVFTHRGKFSAYELSNAPVAIAPKMKDPDPVPMPKPKDPPKIERAAMPDEATLAKAEIKLRGLLRDDYAKKLPSERKALAVKLLGLADDTADDPAQRYVMLRDARDFAIEVFDTPLAMQALDGILRAYVVDADALRLATFDKIKDSAGNNTTLRILSEMAMAASDTAIAADSHSYALKYAQLAAEAANRANLPAAMRDEADAQIARAQKGAEAFKPVQAALDKLKNDANDPDASFVVGRYRCFLQGRWDEGIKSLAKGATGDLKAAAALDAAAPPNGPGDVKIAEAWWQAAQTAADVEKTAALYRARHWYARSRPALAGDARTQAESRLGFSVGGTDYRTGLIVAFTAKVPSILMGKNARVDAGIDFNAGEFKAEGAGVATDLKANWTGAIAPQRPGRYRFAVAATDPVVVRIDGRTVIDTNAKGARPDATVSLPDRPVPISIEFKCINTDKHNFKLLWSIPGVDAEVPIPAEALWHDKKLESLLGK